MFFYGIIRLYANGKIIFLNVLNGKEKTKQLDKTKKRNGRFSDGGGIEKTQRKRRK